MGLEIDTICDKRCDVCKEPEKVKLKWKEYEKNATSYGTRTSLLDLPTTVTLTNSQQFQTAREMHSDVRLRDGTLASFAPQKRKHDQYLGETTMDKLENQSSFQNAGELLNSREFLFGKKGKRKEASPPPDDSPTKYLHLFPSYKLPGCNGKMRDKSISRIIDKLCKKLDTIQLSKSIEEIAIELEGYYFSNAKILRVYQDSIVSLQMKINASTLDLINGGMFEKTVCKYIK